jgi:hypothetical protein
MSIKVKLTIVVFMVCLLQFCSYIQNESPSEFSIGGTLSGLLSGKSLQITNNGTNTLDLFIDGEFSFPAIPDNSTYNIIITQQPNGQTCTINNGSGTVSGENIFLVQITCSINSYSIGGAVSGISSGELVLQNNSNENISINYDGSFSFTTPVASGAAYDVQIISPPSGHSCIVVNGTGYVDSVDISGITVTCSLSNYTIGGTLSGLATGNLLILQNGADTINLNANGSFTFNTSVQHGSTYNVIIYSSSTGQACNITNEAGSINGANISNILVNCTNNTYTVGGTISGLSGSITLQNNNSDDLTLSLNGLFVFSTPIRYQSAYNVTILTQSNGQSCAVNNGTGNVGAANITSITIVCTTNSHLVGGSISGIISGTLLLQNNGGDNLSITANGSFNFITPSDYGNTYDVSILGSPAGHTCNIENGYGFMGDANITNISVVCSTIAYTLGGTIAGLDPGKTLKIVNQLEELTISANGTFVFTNPLLSGYVYIIYVSRQPAGQTCILASQSGIIYSNINSVSIQCNETVPPQTTASIDGYLGNTIQNVTLTCTDNQSGCRRIVYTTDGSIPTISTDGLTVHGTEVPGNSTTPISMSSDTELNYFSEDNDGNKEPYKKHHYHISNSGFLYIATNRGLSIGSGQIPVSFSDNSTNMKADYRKPIFYDSTTNIYYYCTDYSLNISTDNGLNWTKRTYINGLPSWGYVSVFANGSNVYVATNNGLAVSTDGANTFTMRTQGNGLGSTAIYGVYEENNIIYVATYSGLSISTDGGNTFINKTTSDGLGSNNIQSVYILNGIIYVATIPDYANNFIGGLSISADGGSSFINKTTTSGLGSNFVYDVDGEGSIVYVATRSGLSISADGGSTFINKSISDGILSPIVQDIYLDGSNLYLATTAYNNNGINALSFSTDGGNSFISKS